MMGRKFCAKVICKVLDQDAQDHQLIKFLLALGDGELEELISYNELSDLISEQQQSHVDGQQKLLGFHHISDHHGLLKSHDPHCKGSSWNLSIHWDDGTVTWEPLNEIAKFDPVTIAIYRQQHNLLSLPGWCFLQCTAKCQHFINKLHVNAARHTSKCQIWYKFGIKIPHTYAEALKFDQENNKFFGMMPPHWNSNNSMTTIHSVI